MVWFGIGIGEYNPGTTNPIIPDDACAQLEKHKSRKKAAVCAFPHEALAYPTVLGNI